MAKINFIHLPYSKENTQDKRIETLHLPKKVILPLSQHTGAPSEPIVQVGDIVKTGTMVAQPKGFISSSLHSSISGKVLAIEDAPHPIMGTSKAVIIESDGQDTKAFSYSKTDVDSLGLSKEEILQPFGLQDEPSGENEKKNSPRAQIIRIIKDAGIVGLGGAAFPTHVKMSPPSGKKIDTLIINGAECEPFLTCDHQLMLEKPKEIILGIRIIARVLDVKNIIIGIEDNKQDAIEHLGSVLFRNQKPDYRVQIKRLRSRYPQGGEKQLIKALLNKEVPSGGLPLDIGVVVNNVQTVFSVYEAVYFRKPLYERVITVSGNFLNTGKNVLARIGTPIRDLLSFCGADFKRDIYKVVMGGPMTGVAQCDLDAPIIKGTSGILVLDKRFKLEDEEINCIRCSRCIDACPVSIMPSMIGLAVNNDRFDIANSYSPLDCIECGSCSYVCPSKIPLVQLIKLAKGRVKM